MTQITLNIEDKSILPHLKKILNHLQGVSIVKSKRNKTNGLDEAIEDVNEGRVYHAKNADDMFNQIFGN